MALYPDNAKRANRVHQLSQDIASIQVRLKADLENAHASEKAAIDMVNELARDAGYQTLDVYAQVADMVNVEVRTAFDQQPEAGGDSFFGVISSLLIPGAMIGEAFLGAQIRDELREAIVDLSARRFIVKKMELEARVFLYSMNDVKVILRMRSALDTQLKAGRITAEDVAEEMRQWAGKIEANIKTAQNQISPDKIWDILATQDDESNAWRDDDPSLERVLQWIKDHESDIEK